MTESLEFRIEGEWPQRTHRAQKGNMTEQEANEKCDLIRQIAYQLHVYLGVGYLEMGFLSILAQKNSNAEK